MKPKNVVPLLLNWFEHNARDLPWRRTRDPYAIWVSEIMLQQTQVEPVIPFWKRWMRSLPTIRSLARATPEKIHKLWEGLGYYTRVRNLQKASHVILEKHNGLFPTAYKDVLELPGIGRYTAGAICSIAFNQPKPVLDGNVTRVLTRLCGIDGDPKTKTVNSRLWDLAQCLVLEAATYSGEGSFCRSKKRRPIANRKLQIATGNAPFVCSHLNQSLMELGALVCTPRQPRCDRCPLTKLCIARKQKLVEFLPRSAPRPAATKRRFVALVVRRHGRILVRQRPASVVNAHLWEFPNVEVRNKDGDPAEACRKILGISPSAPKHTGTIHHAITRYRIRLDFFEISSHNLGNIRSEGGRWLRSGALKRLPFSSAHKRILATLD
jgi:A/G-specific adenine glycosylase